LNYQVFFLFGFAGAMLSWWHVHHIHVPDPPAQAGAQPAFWRDLREMVRFPGYSRYVIAVFVLQLALGMIAPLLPLYWVRSLAASDQQVSLVLSTATGAMVIGSLLMQRVVRRIGRERALALGGLGYACYPLLTSVIPSMAWLIPAAALAGLFTAAINVNLFDNLVTVTPEGERMNYMSVYNTAQHLALFTGPLIAGLLAVGTGGPVVGLRVAAGVGIGAGVLLAARRRIPNTR
jgi:MFS family permease